METFPIDAVYFPHVLTNRGDLAIMKNGPDEFLLK
jgi:hypothetical protein